MANPWCKPLDPFHMKRFAMESALVVFAQCRKPLDGFIHPRVDAFFLHVHVDMEHTSAGLERKQARFPNGFTRRQESQMATVSHAFEAGE